MPLESRYDQKVEVFEKNLISRRDEASLSLDSVVSIIKSGEEPKEFLQTIDNPFYVFKDGALTYWNNYTYALDFSQFDLTFDDWKLNELKSGVFYSKAAFVTDADNAYAIVSVIPFERRFELRSKYLINRNNEQIFGDENVAVSTVKTSGSYLVGLGDDPLYINFQQVKLSPSVVDYALLWSALLFFVGFVLIQTFWIQGGVLNALVYAIQLAVLRMGLFYLKGINIDLFPEVFDPTVFAYSDVIPSLGDLFLHVFFLCLILTYGYKNSFKKALLRQLSGRAEGERKILSILISIVFFVIFILYTWVLRIVFQHSSYEFNVDEQLNFGWVIGIYGLCFILLSYATILFVVICFKVGKLLRTNIEVFQRRVILFTIAGYVLVHFAVFDDLLLPVLVVLFAGLTWVFKLFESLSEYDYRAYMFVVLSAMLCSFTAGLEIYKKSSDKATYERSIVAEHLLYQRDPKSEFLIHQVSSQIADNGFIERMFKQPGVYSKKLIVQKVYYSYLTTYFDQFNGQVGVYNAQGDALFGSYTSLTSLREFLKDGWYETGYDEQYFKKRLGSDNSKYVQIIPLRSNGVLLGFVSLELEKKNLEGRKILPALLGGNYEKLKDKYDYALFNDGVLNYSVGKFDYTDENLQEKLTDSINLQHEWRSSGFMHYLTQNEKGGAVVVSYKVSHLKFLFDNFSLHFLTLIVITFFFVLGRYIYFYLRKKKVSYTAKIQMYLNLAFFVPLIIVSLTVISVTNSNFEKETRVSFEHKSKHLAAIVYDKLSSTQTSRDFKQEFKEVAHFSQTDLSVFSQNGKLMMASQPLIYEAGLLSKWINPEAIEEINAKQKAVFISERIGEFEYQAIYIALFDHETGYLKGILRVPSFKTSEALEENRILVFTSMLEIFTIIFLLILVLSQFSYNALARPLKFIAQGIRKTTLSRKNELLVWEADDEIGALVNEYNEMLIKLEESKSAIAQSEKESAWREMAQQVAHEIKNPLTPMKLKLQHLIRTFEGDDDRKKEAMEALLIQVDTLSDIATSFSSFAKMPTPVNERFDLASALKAVVTVFENDGSSSVALNLADGNFMVNADQKLISRTVSNLIINGKQSYLEGVKPAVSIELSHHDNQALIVVSDEGEGIPDKIQQKVFLPNFTTKETGSGIGLAIAKRGVEHAGGKIWFETVEGQGTKFFIELPLIS